MNRLPVPASTALYVNTNIEYELDMSLFPGIGDPEQNSEPSILVHSPGSCFCFHNNDTRVLSVTGSNCSHEEGYGPFLGELPDDQNYFSLDLVHVSTLPNHIQIEKSPIYENVDL